MCAQTAKLKSNSTREETRSLDALAFYLGAHRIDPATVADEIDARFESETAVEKHAVLTRLRELEGKLADTRRKLPEAQAVWKRVRTEIGDATPSAVEAVTLAVCAVFTLGVDAIFIAPSMDLLNIVDPAMQLVAGAGIALLSTLLFHVAGTAVIAKPATSVVKAAGLGAACATGFALVVWGLLRGYQLGFSAMLAENPLGRFLAEHPVLSSIFYAFLTVATPLMGAISSIQAWHSLERRRVWKHAHDLAEKLHADEVRLQKEIQLAKDELAHLDHVAHMRGKEWKAVLAQYYGRGVAHGARQETLAMVAGKSMLAALCAAPALLLAPALPLAIVAAAPVAAGIGAFAWFNRRRLHPDHVRYLNQENTQFAVPDRSFQQAGVEMPTERLLTKGEE